MKTIGRKLTNGEGGSCMGRWTMDAKWTMNGKVEGKVDGKTSIHWRPWKWRTEIMGRIGWVGRRQQIGLGGGELALRL